MFPIAHRIADRLILSPTRHRVSAIGKTRKTLPFRNGELEIWRQRVGTMDPDQVDVCVLKFQGTAGRAERATYHPMDYWSDLSAELWSVNPPGYGGSSGSASVSTLAASGTAAYLEMERFANGRPIIVMGNSLGAVTALHLASNFPVAGLVLRNPPPLRQLIVGRFGWWNLWLGAAIIAAMVPNEICSIKNATRAECPAIFLTSGKDRIVPPLYQDKVIREYAGPYRLLTLADADHADTLNLHEQREYLRHLQWLRDETLSPPISQQNRVAAQVV